MDMQYSVQEMPVACGTEVTIPAPCDQRATMADQPGPRQTLHEAYDGAVSRVTVGGAVVEVRYSEICAAAWGRITQAAAGDTVRISAGAAGQDAAVDADRDAYTPMVTVKRASDAKACATLTSGTKGCTTPQ